MSILEMICLSLQKQTGRQKHRLQFQQVRQYLLVLKERALSFDRGCAQDLLTLIYFDNVVGDIDKVLYLKNFTSLE